MTYQEWMEAFAKHWGSADGLCYYAVAAMQRQFPELAAFYGTLTFEEGEEYHWWCVAPDGTILDPTFSQFEGLGELRRRDVIDAYVASAPVMRAYQRDDVALEMYDSVNDPHWPGVTRY